MEKSKTNTESMNDVRSNEDIQEAVMLWIDNQDIALEKYGHISEWDVSNVTDMSNLFKCRNEFNEDISRWNVSKVTNMANMFGGATSFNQPIGEWDVSNVTTMECMFKDASSFNQSIGNWDVSNVTRMQYMFWEATEFTYQNEITGWNLTNEDCDY